MKIEYNKKKKKSSELDNDWFAFKSFLVELHKKNKSEIYVDVLRYGLEGPASQFWSKCLLHCLIHVIKRYVLQILPILR